MKNYFADTQLNQTSRRFFPGRRERGPELPEQGSMLRAGKNQPASPLKMACVDLVLAGAIAGLLWYMAGSKDLMVFSWAALAAGLVPSLWRDNARLYKIITIAAGAAIVLAAVVLHGQLLDGSALIMNRLHGIAEQAQAYVYDRYEVGASGEENEFLCRRFAAVWISLAAGLLLTLPKAGLRPWTRAGLAAAVMIVFAYYGLLPQAAGAAVMAAAVVVIAGRGKLRTVWPLLAVLAIIFAAALAIDPGENKAISRADEQLRDKLAFQTAQLSGQQQLEKEVQEEQSGGGGLAELLEDNILTENSRLRNVLILSLIILLVLFIPAVLHDRLERKRKKIREGIDSEDPGQAVRAMFPYAVRWLKVCGVRTDNKPFSTLCPQVSEIISREYAADYERMSSLWKKAAYSDREITEEHRQEMSRFVEQTKELVRRRISWRGKADVRFRLAL